LGLNVKHHRKVVAQMWNFNLNPIFSAWAHASLNLRRRRATLASLEVWQ